MMAELRNAFDGFLRRLDTAETIISELEVAALESKRTQGNKRNRGLKESKH